MELLQGLLRTKSSRFLLFVVFLQSLYVVFFHPYSPSQAEIQRVTTNKHTSTAKTLSTSVTIEDFGLMAKQVAALADLADHYVNNRYLDASSLTELVSRTVPLVE